MEANAKSAQVEKHGQVTEWMKRLQGSIKRADELCQHVGNHLGPLLRDEPPTGDKGAGEVEEQLVPLANQIRGYVEQIDRTSDQYQKMIDLLEL